MVEPESEVAGNIRDLVARFKEEGHSDVAIVAALTEVIEARRWSDEWMNCIEATRRKILHGGSSSLFAN